MSRLGRKPLVIPEKTKVEYKNGEFEVTGPLGKIKQRIVAEKLGVKIENGQVSIIAKDDSDEANMLHGLTRGILKNNLEGVSRGFKKGLEIHGLGYKAAVDGNNLTLQLGFSHPVVITIPEGIKVAIEKQTQISISGVDKEVVGELAASIHSLRKPEPYKGTGVRYVGEHIIRKAGKAAAGAGAAVGGAKK